MHHKKLTRDNYLISDCVGHNYEDSYRLRLQKMKKYIKWSNEKKPSTRGITRVEKGLQSK